MLVGVGLGMCACFVGDSGDEKEERAHCGEMIVCRNLCERSVWMESAVLCGEGRSWCTVVPWTLKAGVDW